MVEIFFSFCSRLKDIKSKVLLQVLGRGDIALSRDWGFEEICAKSITTQECCCYGGISIGVFQLLQITTWNELLDVTFRNAPLRTDTLAHHFCATVFHMLDSTQ